MQQSPNSTIPDLPESPDNDLDLVLIIWEDNPGMQQYFSLI